MCSAAALATTAVALGAVGITLGVGGALFPGVVESQLRSGLLEYIRIDNTETRACAHPFVEPCRA